MTQRYYASDLDALRESPEGRKKLVAFLRMFGFTPTQCTCERPGCVYYVSPHPLSNNAGRRCVIRVPEFDRSRLVLFKEFFFESPNTSIEWMHRMNTSEVEDQLAFKHEFTWDCGIDWKNL